MEGMPGVRPTSTQRDAGEVPKRGGMPCRACRECAPLRLSGMRARCQKEGVCHGGHAGSAPHFDSAGCGRGAKERGYAMEGMPGVRPTSTGGGKVPEGEYTLRTRGVPRSAALSASGEAFEGALAWECCLRGFVFVKGALRRTLARGFAPDGKRRLRAPGKQRFLKKSHRLTRRSGADARPASRGWLRLIVRERGVKSR
jgi:hypothetical protein